MNLLQKSKKSKSKLKRKRKKIKTVINFILIEYLNLNKIIIYVTILIILN
jgi:hypothetical protein